MRCEFNRLRLILAVAILFLPLASSAAPTQTPVLTRSYNNARTGANTTESLLSPDALSRKGLVRMRLPLAGEPPIDDPRIEAQPLYMPALKMADGQLHDVIFVCSMANSIYAYDAHSGHTLSPYPISLGPAVPAKETNIINNAAYWKLNSEWGILSTPVIDREAGVMDVVNCAIEPDGQPVFRLNAIDLATGFPRHPAQAIQAETGQERWHATFNPVLAKQRAALLLTPLQQTGKTASPKVLYMACGLSEEGASGQHGWVIAFDPETLKTTAAWCTTPHGYGGGIWQAGQGPCADEQGNVYVVTSNGDMESQKKAWSLYFGDHLFFKYNYNQKIDPVSTDFAESFVKLHYTAPNGSADSGRLEVAGWWCPFHDSDRRVVDGYDFVDQDLGSSGAVLPDGSNMVLGAGKDGILYVFDRDHLGNAFQDYSVLKQNPPAFITYDAPPEKSSIGDLDFFAQDNKTHHLHGSPVVWTSPDRGSLLYVWGENEYLRAWNFDTNTGHVSLLAKGAELVTADSPHGGMPGGMLTLSANGSVPHTGIVWATTPTHHDSSEEIGSGILRAYDATELDTARNTDGSARPKLLWDSVNGSAADKAPATPQFPFTYDKFCPLVVADGRVIVATYDGHVDVFTLAP